MTRRRLIDHLLPALLLALSTSGCGKFREISACRSVAREINASVDEIEDLSNKKPVDEARIAKRYAALAKSLQPRAEGDKPLALAVRDYVSIVQAASLSVRNHAEMLKTPYAKLAEPRRELERLGKRERAAVVRIEAECHN
jgi:hypothetical protein